MPRPRRTAAATRVAIAARAGLWQLSAAVARLAIARACGWLVLAALLPTGCDRVRAEISARVEAELEERIAAVGTEMPGTLPPPALDGQARLADKLALYHECVRRSRGPVVESWRRYQAGVDPKTGVGRRNGPKPLVYPVMTELQPCRRAHDEGEALDPPLPTIEHATTRYLEASIAFATVADELDLYFGDERYKSDAWAQGKLLAPALAQAFAEFEAAELALSSELDRVRDGLDELRLGQLESAGGRNLAWHCHRVALAAKAHVRCARRELDDAEACARPLGQLRDHAAAMRQYAEAHQGERLQAFWYLSFDAALEAYVTDAEALDSAMHSKRQIDDRVPLREALRDRFDELRSAFDNLRFDLR